MLPDGVSNTGPLTYESGALPISLRGPAKKCGMFIKRHNSRHLSQGPDQCQAKYTPRQKFSIF